MSKPIKDGHIIEPKDRIVTLGTDYSGSRRRTIVIDKKAGYYVLTITETSSGSFEEYDLKAKIPPDTGVRLRRAKKKR